MPWSFIHLLVWWYPCDVLFRPESAHHDLHHLHWLVQLRRVLGRESLIGHRQHCRGSQDITGHTFQGIVHQTDFYCQVVGKDNIYPGVNFFEKGYNANNDPFRGYILIFFASMGFVMLADLNAIGILASNFFLASYALMNLSCFHSDYTKSPRLA